MSLVGLLLEFLELLQTVIKIYDLLCKPARTLFYLLSLSATLSSDF